MKAITIFTIILLTFIITVHSVYSQPTNEVNNISDDVTVEKLTDGVWLYTAYYDLPELKHCPANGLIIVDGQHSMMINLPWTDNQTAVIFDWVSKEQKAAVEKVVSTHSHLDCAGGLAEAHRRKAESFSLDKTAEILKNTGKTVTENQFTDSLYLSCGSIKVELTFPGEGHTCDNIIAWLPQQKILFGGCLIKSADATGKGNIEDANITEWPKTVMKVKEKYPTAEIVIPGHGKPGGIELLDHTIKIIKK